jgi:hypothetical protein
LTRGSVSVAPRTSELAEVLHELLRFEQGAFTFDDGPADGSGEPVEVDGDARLEMVLQPASGVDLSADEFTITYDGPDRISTDQTELITDLVRTGDFEAVLTWVAGATEAVPFRVQTLSSPTRIVVDLAA